MTDYRRLLFTDPGAEFIDITRYLGEETVSLKMAERNFELMCDTVHAFSEAVDKAGNTYEGVRGALVDFKYPIERLRQYFRNQASSGLTEKDAIIFVDYLRPRYDRLISLAKELDKE